MRQLKARESARVTLELEEVSLVVPRGFPSSQRRGQVTKSVWWMPRHQEAMKDVFTCEKLWGAGRELRSIDVRMGKPNMRHGILSCTEYIGV